MDDLPKVNSVRAIIDLFEDNCRNETAQRLNKTMSKSFAGLSYIERKFKSFGSNDTDTLFNLEQRLLSLSGRLKTYKAYAKDVHVAIQEELVDIITLLMNIESKSNTSTYRKRELVLDAKAQFRELNDRLPGSEQNMRQGFGDSTYKPYMWSRTDSLQRKKTDSPEKTPWSPSDSNPHSDDTLLTPSSFKRMPFLIGGAAGVRRPPHSIGFDTTLRGGIDDQAKTLQRSASEDPNKTSPKPIVNGEFYQRWSYNNQLSGRRRPVSLGSTVVTLNSAEDFISSMKSHKNSEATEKTEDAEDVGAAKLGRNEADDGLQSVDLLKRFFELKSAEREKRKKEKSYNAKEDQRDGFEEYVRNIEKSVQVDEDQQESGFDVSSNETMVEREDKEDEDVLVISSRPISVQLGLNSPLLRTAEKDELVVRSLTINDDVEEGDSFCSDHSIYLDPVD